MEIAGQVGAHRLSVGIKGYRLDYQEHWLRRNPSAANPYAIDIYDPVYGGSAAPLLPFTQNHERRWSGTLYLQDMWEATDRLSFSGGVRFDAYRQRILNERTGAVAKAVGEPLNFRVGGRYRLSDVFALHANWGESYILNSGTSRELEGFAPERGKGYELGITAAWPGIDLAATWFDIAKAGILTNDPVDPNYLAPVGRLTSRGIELDAAIKLGQRWQIVANYAWTKARADDTAFATDAVLNVPEHAGSIFVSGRFSVAPGRDLTLSAGAAYVGARAGAIDTSGLVLPDYVKAKVGAEYRLSPLVAVRLTADNLFNARYAQSSYSPVWIFPGAPRTVKASIELRY